MTSEAWILLFQAALSVIGGAVSYGILLANVREVKRILTGENGLVQRVEVLERRDAARQKHLSAASGG